MSVISIRFNQAEEKILRSLTEHFNEDKSALIKHSLREMYEDIKDLQEIEIFEQREKKGKVLFYSDQQMSELLK